MATSNQQTKKMGAQLGFSLPSPVTTYSAPPLSERPFPVRFNAVGLEDTGSGPDGLPDGGAAVPPPSARGGRAAPRAACTIRLILDPGRRGRRPSRPAIYDDGTIGDVNGYVYEYGYGNPTSGHQETPNQIPDGGAAVPPPPGREGARPRAPSPHRRQHAIAPFFVVSFGASFGDHHFGPAPSKSASESGSGSGSKATKLTTRLATKIEWA